MNNEVFKKLSEMLSNSTISSDSANVNNTEVFNNIVSSFTSNNSNNDNNNFDFSNIDMETILKIKNLMGKMSSNQRNPRSNLLLSLKPYLKPSRKEKLDQYLQFINMTSILESFNETGGHK